MGINSDRSCLEPGGDNLFQVVERLCIEAVQRGINVIRLDAGVPNTLPLQSALDALRVASESRDLAMHKYQNTTLPGVPGFARLFTQEHINRNLETARIHCIPTIGTKGTIESVLQACGAINGKILRVATMHIPGYPTPGTMSGYVGAKFYPLKLTPQNKFIVDIEDIPPKTDVLMLNYPHNPSGQIATEEFWRAICEYAQDTGTTVINDEAYIKLAWNPDSCSLAEVAPDYDIRFGLLFSASKEINVTGWRCGTAAGSKGFIEDLRKIEENKNSGPVAMTAYAVLEAMLHDHEGQNRIRQDHERRLRLLIDILENCGMKLAIKPQAGFFALFKTPDIADGQRILNAEQFNRFMINKGISGVHFDSAGPESYIRYFAGNHTLEEQRDEIERIFSEANIEYF